MAVHLLVDGYNLIRQSLSLSEIEAGDLEAGREALLAALAEYRRRRARHAVTVVFDGWRGGGLRESHAFYQGIKVIYSRRGERADEVIKRLLSREGRRAVLISSDRALQAAAERAGAVWLSAEEFERRCLTADPDIREPGEPADQGDPPPGRKKGPARRLKKKWRLKKQRLRKL